MKISCLSRWLCSLAFAIGYAGTANARILEFTYTSNDFGVVGSYTMDENDLLNNIGDPYAGQVSNNFIIDLNFSVDGKTWSTADIVRSASAGYFTTGSIPEVDPGSTNGAYATNGFGSIVQFNPNTTGVRFGNISLLGTWSTSVSAVPVPAAIWLFGSGLLGLIGMARRKAA
jgi:hypothetical protein